MEGLQSYSVFEAAVGEPYTKEKAIPQGDSWSTRALAAMLITWARRLRAREAEPRFLADDMFARDSANNREADARDHLKARIETVIEDTLDYIRNMGGDAQVHKCAFLASSPKSGPNSASASGVPRERLPRTRATFELICRAPGGREAPRSRPESRRRPL